MFAWFERRIDPYPQERPAIPPKSLTGFMLHYSRGAIPWLILLSLLSAPWPWSRCFCSAGWAS